MTKYRIVSNGYWHYLQYEVEYKFVFWTFKTWKYIFKPYYNGSTYEREENIYINTLNENIEKFTKSWPNIEKYFEYYKLRQAELVKIYNKKQEKIEEKKKKIIYL